MKLQFITVLTILIASLTAIGGESVTINLWPDGNPNNNGNPNDQTAEMTVFTPEDGKDTGIAVAILPGGAYAGLAMGYEGLDIAEWFAKNGITAGVVRYRLPNGNPAIPESDARQAIRILRKMVPPVPASWAHLLAVTLLQQCPLTKRTRSPTPTSPYYLTL